MTKESQTESFTLRGALDDTRDICHHKRLAVTIADDAQRGFHRGERIVSYLRTRIRQSRYQSRFTSIGEAHQSDIREQLQLEDDGHLLHRLTRLGIARRLVGCRAELEIAESASSAFQQHDLLTVVGDVADVLARLRIIDHRTAGHVDIDILAIGAVTLVAPAVPAVLGEDMTLVFQMEQGPVVMVAAQDDTATLATVTAVRSPVGIVLHVAQVHRPFAALTRAAHDLHIIYEIRLHRYSGITGCQSRRIYH